MASYYVWSAAAGSANGTSWANAYTTMTTAFSGKVAGDVFYVAHDHAESTAGVVNMATAGTITNPQKVICVDRAGSVPPVSADRRTTAQISTTGANNISFNNGSCHYDGIIFNAGSGASGTASLFLTAQASSWTRFDNCSLRLNVTGAGASFIQLGSTAAGGTMAELNNTTMSFGGVGNSVFSYGIFKWRNTPSALLGTIPTLLFTPISVRGGSVECIGVDFSAAGSGKTIVGALGAAQSQMFKFVDCKLNAAVTKSAVPLSHGSTEVDFVRSGATGVNYNVYRHRISGELMEETTIVRTGGASDGTTGLAWKVITTANCTYSIPFETPPIAIWNDTTGSAVTATVECIGAAIGTDKEVWLDVEYLADASSPQASFANDSSDILATAANQTSSSEVWGGSTAAFKLAVTFTAAQAGWIYCRVKVGKASSTFYIDPLVTLS